MLMVEPFIKIEKIKPGERISKIQTMGSRSAKTAPRLWKVVVSTAIAGMICAITFADAFLMNPLKVMPAAMSSQSPVSLASPTQLYSSTAAVGPAPVLKSLLKKPSKVLTVGVEYSPQQSDDLVEDRPEGNLDVFSMKLRQQAKVSFIVCSDLPTIKLLNAEQETAKGNFPGPVPIVYHGEWSPSSTSSLEDVSEAGASAIVVDAGTPDALALAESASSTGLETIWKVSTVEEAKQVLESTNELADVFLLDVRVDDDVGATTISEIIEALPKSSMCIATLYDPMQEDGVEIETGKEFKSMGCASVFVKKACVGDKEDIDYASFVVSGLTSKASKEFKFSSLTGSTNGHFGGIQSNSSVKWERTRLSVGEEDGENHDDDE